MASTRRIFQMELLRVMNRSYRDGLLRDLDLTHEDILELSQHSEIVISENCCFVGLSKYVEVLGAPAHTQALELAPDNPFVGSTRYHFLLDLWPHLFWAVNEQPNGGLWGVEFHNQFPWDTTSLDLSNVRPGVWTRQALEPMADHVRMVDGWNEAITLDLTFQEEVYRASFVLGLLQSWARVGARQGE